MVFSMTSQKKAIAPQLSLLPDNDKHLHRKSSSGLVVTLNRVHLADFSELPKELVVRMTASSEVENIHTARISNELETALIKIFKKPVNSHFNLEVPDTQVLLNVGTGEILEKPPHIQDWSDMGWACRWSPADLKEQMGYQKNRNINLRVQLANFLNVIERVWLPSDKETNQLKDPSMLDAFLNVNSWETKKSLKDANDDAFYFNINTVYLTDLLNSPRASVIYNKNLLKNLRSVKAIDMANYLIMSMDFSGKNCAEIRTTTLESREGMYNIFMSGKRDPRALQWKEFVREYINKHVSTIKKHFGLTYLKFCTNRKRGDDMMCWFEYQMSSVFPGAYADDLPQAILQQSKSTTTPEFATGKPRTFLPSDKYSWDEISVEEKFKKELQSVISKLGYSISVDKVINAYTEKAIYQNRKSLKAWVSPLRRWLAGKTSPFNSMLIEESSDTIDFDEVTTRAPLSSSSPRNPVKSVQRNSFQVEIINDQMVQSIARASLKSGNDFLINLDDAEDYVRWQIDKFSAHHMAVGTENKTPNEWGKLFGGWCNTGIHKEEVKRRFISRMFESELITESPVFRAQIEKHSEKEIQLIHQVLEIFKIEHSTETHTIRVWQKKAWNWLVRENALKRNNIILPELNINF